MTTELPVAADAIDVKYAPKASFVTVAGARTVSAFPSGEMPLGVSPESVLFP
jgi:hypothetical protein